jgi:hypothetical protein
MNKGLNRREFLQNTALAGAGLAIPGNVQSAPFQIREGGLNEKLRIGFIGVGLRGQSHVELALNRDDCEVAAINDIDAGMIERTQKIIDGKGAKQPQVFDKGERDFYRLLQEPDIDAVVISTPWEWHTEMSIAAMRAGKYTGVEVCGGFSIEECWRLVDAYEETRVPLFFLENVCYRRDVMAILNMVRQDLFGEMIHLECGYQHDLRGVKFNDGKTAYNSGVEFGEKGFSEAKWRTQHSIHRNGDLYPTHGIGPVAQYIDINRGNRFLYLTSTSTKARGLHDYIVNHEKGGPTIPTPRSASISAMW